MTLQQLEYVIALDKYRHFVTAAEKLAVTQPTITLQLKKLEDEIGIQIFDRSTSPLKPTTSGEIIISKAKQILNEVHQLKDILNSEKDSIEGTFKIGIIPTISPYIVPKFIGSFIQQYPQTHLDIYEMQSDTIIQSLKKDDIDIGILVSPLDETFIKEIPLYNEPFLYYGRVEELSEMVAIESKDIEKREGLWLLNSGHCFRNQVLNICEIDQSHKKNIAFQSGSIETLKKMVDNYGGFTLIPELAKEPKDHAQTIPFVEPQPIREVCLAVHKGFPKEGLLEILKKEILRIVPKEFKKNQRIIKMRWR